MNENTIPILLVNYTISLFKSMLVSPISRLQQVGLSFFCET